MENYRPSLRVVGIALIIVGVLDIGFMIYCLATDTGYSSSFNIFAVIAGILLVKGGLKTANIVAFFSALMLSCFVGLFLVFPLLMPFDLMLTYLRIYPIASVGAFLLAACSLVFFGWIYRRLTVPLILAAIVEQHPRLGSFWRRPRTGFLAGALLIVVVTVFLSLMTNGESAKRATMKAKLKVGDGYKFYVHSLSIQSKGARTHVAAGVTAYNQKEIKQVDIEWNE